MQRIVLVLCLLILHGSLGADIIVDSTGLRGATQRAEDGDTIVIPTGVYAGASNTVLYLYGRNLTFTSQTGNPKDVTIDCSGINNANMVIVTLPDGAGVTNYNDTTLTFNGITIRDGAENGGGALYFSTLHITGTTTVTITNCVFYNNLANVGGAIYASARGPIFLSISDSTFSANRAEFAGAIYVGAVTATITDCVFHDHEATVAGGVLYIDELSTVHIHNSGAYSNVAEEDGGAVYVYNHSFVEVKDTYFNKNSAISGGAFFVDTSDDIYFINVTFLLNVAEEGGAILVDYGSVVANNSLFSQNAAFAVEQNGGGGAVCGFSESFVTIYSSHITSNSGDAGGAIALDHSTAILSYSLVSSNFATEGGAFYLQNAGRLEVDECTVSDNSANKGNTVYCNLSSIAFTKSVIDTPTQLPSESNGVACAVSRSNATANSCAIQATGSGDWSKVCVHLDTGDSSEAEKGSDGLAKWKVTLIIVVFSVLGAVVIGLVIAAIVIKGPTAFQQFK